MNYSGNTDSNNNNNSDSTKKSNILIDQLMVAYFAGRMSDLKIVDHICTMMGAGTDTSALTLSYAILMLAMHRSVQDMVQKELDSIFPHGVSESISYEKLQELPYLECVLKETLRLFAPGPLIARFTTADVPLETCTIPKDAFILISIYNLHRVWITFLEIFLIGIFILSYCLGNYSYFVTISHLFIFSRIISIVLTFLCIFRYF